MPGSSERVVPLTPERKAEAEALGPLFTIDYMGTCAASVMFQTRLCRKNKTIVDTRDAFMRRMGSLGPQAWVPRRRVVEWMDPNIEGRGWFATLYVYEIVKASAKREVSDLESDEPGFSHEDYAKLTEWHTHRFMAMCMCIFHDDKAIEWVRGTYVTEDQVMRRDFEMNPLAISADANPERFFTPEELRMIPFPPIFTVTPDTVKPCLLESDVNKIDSVRAQDPKLKANPAPVPQSVRARVIGDKDTRVSFPGSLWQLKHYRVSRDGHGQRTNDGAGLDSRDLLYYMIFEVSEASHIQYQALFITSQL
ncbi:hypothetical protein CVT26_005551 [Gymnopilus dilepis]|uniref:Uncharacterized protein n=1 Tax=Gymnopilus dilepis TaxID=231916 RepID=A0A409WBX4_9AGAR|nr:hypothetical protein CVT26_005551 [Gymnopilus dilepis]